MKYYIQRQLNEYGPYTLADLQRYVAQGNIQLTDLARSEGMADWVPVSQVLGNIPVPVPPPAMQPPVPAVYGSMPAAGGGGAAYGGQGTVYGAPATVYGAAVMPAMNRGPVPNDFHWALVFLITCFCGLFQAVWIFIEAGFVKQIDRESKAIPMLVGGIVAQIVALAALFTSAAQSRTEEPGPGAFVPFFLFVLIGWALHVYAVFHMRSSLEEYYNTVEPIN